MQEFFWLGYSDTAVALKIVNGGGATYFVITYGTDVLTYTVPRALTYNVKIICLGFKKNGVEGKLYFIGSPLVSKTNMGSIISDTFVGSFSLGVGVKTEIYELHIFNSAINNNDMDMYMQMLIWKYKIKHRPSKAYLPVAANDVATKYYVDSLSIYYKIPVLSTLNMATYRIINWRVPVNPTDAATKGYCDNKFMRLSAQQALDMNNNRITGFIIPVNNMDAVNKNYVDNNFVKTPAANMNNFGITNLMAPVIGSDAVTKSYVDNELKNVQLLSGITIISTDVLISSTVIFSVVNSHPSLGGYYFPVSDKVLKLCYNIAMTVGGYITTGIIGVTKNGASMTESENTITQLAQKGMKTYTAPIAFAQGDTLAFCIRNAAVQAPSGIGTLASFTYFVHVLVDLDF